MRHIKSQDKTYQMAGFNQSEWAYALRRGEALQNGCRSYAHEQIDYETGEEFNPCQHTRTEEFVGLPARFCSHGIYAWNVRPGSYYRQTAPVAEMLPSALFGYVTGATKTITVEPERIEQARYDAVSRLRAFAPGTHMNVSQSVLELRDTKQTLTQFLAFCRWAKALGRKGRKIPVGRTATKTLSWASSLADLASAYLWYTFGVEPTVQDVRKFAQQCANGRIETRGYMQKEHIPKGTVVTARYSVRPTIAEIGTTMSSNAGSDGVARYERDDVIMVPSGATSITFPQYRAPVCSNVIVNDEVRGCYFAKTIRDVELEAMPIRKFRWSCPATATWWEVTPFSFVVDWFVDVGKFISQLDRRYTIKEYHDALGPIWLSERRSRTTYVPAVKKVEVQLSGGSVPSNPGYGGTLNLHESCLIAPERMSAEIRYSRGVTRIPAYPPLVTKGRLKTYQISTGMALLAQMFGSSRSSN